MISGTSATGGERAHDVNPQWVLWVRFFGDEVYVYAYSCDVKTKSDPQSLLQQAAQITRLERGKLSILREGANGPFYNHQCRQDGKNVSRYIPRDQVPAVQEAIDGYAKFEALIEEYVDQIVDKTRGEIAARSKKTTAHHNSSSPRTQKSTS